MASMTGTKPSLLRAMLGMSLLNIVLCSSEGRHSVAEGRWDMTLAIERLLHHYDLRIRPNFRGAPVKVGVVIDVISIDSISDVNMEYTVSYDIRQSWVDERLDFRHLYDGEKMTFEGETTLRIWRPDTFIKNGEGSRFHDVTIGQQLMHIFQNGSVIYKLRLTTTASCWMKMHMYPLDAQNCTLQLETYGYTTEDLVYYWLWGIDSVRGFENVELPHFDLDGYDTHETTAKYTTGKFSGLAVSFLIRRNIGYFISETYLPSCLVVAVSWVSFWISPDASAARVLLGIMTVLTMTNLDATVRQGLPKISYVKAIDVYLVGCLIFVFGALLEYAAVNYHYHTATLKKRNKEVRRNWRRLAYSRSFPEGSNGDLMELGTVQPAGGIIRHQEDSDDSDSIVDLTSTGKIRRRLRVMDLDEEEGSGGEHKDVEIIEETIERTTAPKKGLGKEVNCAARSRLNETTVINCGVDCCPECKTPFGMEKIPGVRGIRRKGPHRYYVDVADLMGHSYSKFVRKHGLPFGRRYPDINDDDGSYIRTVTGNGRVSGIGTGQRYTRSERNAFAKESGFAAKPRRTQSEKRCSHAGNLPSCSGMKRRNTTIEERQRGDGDRRRNSFLHSLDMGRLGWFRTFGRRMSLSEITEKLIKNENVNRIDKISRIMFPFTFIVLNIIYWVATYA